jgi:hypothetical protein
MKFYFYYVSWILLDPARIERDNDLVVSFLFVYYPQDMRCVNFAQ